MEDTGNMKQFGRHLILILALVCVFRTASAQPTPHDGYWWRTLDYADKLAYLIGFTDGAVWVAVVQRKTGNPFLDNDAPPKTAAKLDAYYENPRNRHRSIVLVINDLNAKER
jgi:hypothetical protein